MQNRTQTILIADSDNAIKLSLSMFLTREGYKVQTAKIFSEVIQKVQNIGVDVLIMDVELSGIKGYEIVPILKKMDPKLPIIIMSNDSSLELAKKVRETEIFFYAIKPLDLEEIKLAVQDALKRSKK
ncbi:MAG: response regulator [Candidatus Omnitrophica bacterium]|nr:response regulator [Candidatus Omnitrophota bacterium]